MLNQLATEIHENAKSKGFFDSEKNIGEMLCLIHSEVSEALEADRIGLNARWDDYQHFLNKTDADLIHCGEKAGTQFKTAFEGCIKNTFEDEMADIIIRVLVLCAYKGIDIERHIKAKMRYNASRPHKHGKSY